MPHLRRHAALLLACGVCLALGACGGGAWYNPLSWFDPPVTSGGGTGTDPDPTGLLGIFGWLSWVCIVGGVLSLIASFIVPVIPTRASASAVVVGIGANLAAASALGGYDPATLAHVVYQNRAGYLTLTLVLLRLLTRSTYSQTS